MEELILEVRKYPSLYDNTIDEYRNPARKEICWRQISKALNRHPNIVKREWKKIRDCHRQAMSRRKAAYGQSSKKIKTWRFEQQMEFLIPFLTQGGQSVLEPMDFDAEEDNYNNMISIKQENKPDVVPGVMNKRTKSKNANNPSSGSYSSNSVDMQQFNANPEMQQLMTFLGNTSSPSNNLDDLDLFFASMCHSTRKLPRKYQLRIKRELFECILKAEEEHENELAQGTTQSVLLSPSHFAVCSLQETDNPLG